MEHAIASQCPHENIFEFDPQFLFHDFLYILINANLRKPRIAETLLID